MRVSSVVPFSRVYYNFCLHRFCSFQTSPPHFDFVIAPTKTYQTCLFRISRYTVTRGICTTNNRFKRSRIFDSKTKSNSIQELETPGLHRESKSDLLTENSNFFLIRIDTKENYFWFGIWFSALFQPLRNTFCWYTSTCYRGWRSSRIENKSYIYTQTLPIVTCECWTIIA